MNIHQGLKIRLAWLLTLMVAITAGSQRLRADTGACGGAMITLPFTDVPNTNIFFCAIAEAFFTGLTNGTTPTTYAPAAAVTREQMAAFVTRTLDQSLKRGSPRAALNQWWTTTPQYGFNLGTTTVGTGPRLAAADGDDVWVANFTSDNISRVRASDGRELETWTGATDVRAALVALGRVFAVGSVSPGNLYLLNPTAALGAVTLASGGLGNSPQGIAFDGSRIWTANNGGSVSIVTPGGSFPWATTNVSTGFNAPIGILFDGSNIWVTDEAAGTLLKLNGAGGIVQTVTVGAAPRHPAFDGANIWVPSASANNITVVRASTGAVLQTLTGNGLNGPFQAAFDGERILVTNLLGNSVSLWKAADLTPLGNFTTGASTAPTGVCSNGVNFWITLRDANRLARF